MSSDMRCVVCWSMDVYMIKNDLESAIQDAEKYEFMPTILKCRTAAYSSQRQLLGAYEIVKLQQGAHHSVGFCCAHLPGATKFQEKPDSGADGETERCAIAESKHEFINKQSIKDICDQTITTQRA